VPEAWVERAPALRWIHSPGAGADGVLSPAVVRRGVLVSSSRGAFDQPVAEHALALLLALARGLPTLARAQAERRWVDFFGHPTARQLGGRTAAIVGFGGIGARLGEMLRPLGMRVIGVRRHPAPHPGADRVVGEGELLEVLGESDAMVAVLPDSPGAARLIGRAELSALRPGALVVNVGRGSSIDPEALADLLSGGHLAGAGLDVTDPEPPHPDSPLWSAPNVILTGHTAGWSEHHPGPQLEAFGDNLEAYLAGRPLPGAVDPRRGY
jgi:phosphoglycerate dehydrogenase-like enzyme